MKFNDIYVYGRMVPAAAQEGALRRFLAAIETDGPKTAYAMEKALAKEGVNQHALHRGADRLLQKARRSGLITFSKSGWVAGPNSL